jgi:hypothetical protein
VALPIGYEIVRKEVEFCDVKTKRKKERLKSAKMNILETWCNWPWIIKSCSSIFLLIVGLIQKQI